MVLFSSVKRHRVVANSVKAQHRFAFDLIFQLTRQESVFVITRSRKNLGSARREAIKKIELFVTTLVSFQCALFRSLERSHEIALKASYSFCLLGLCAWMSRLRNWAVEHLSVLQYS